MAITEQNAEVLQGSLLQNTYTIPTQIQETTLLVPVFAQPDSSTVHVAYQSENAL